MRKQYMARYGLVFLLCVSCSGCLYIPDAVTRGTREKQAQALIPTIIPGKTTKDEILLALGEPDEVSGDEIHYNWWKPKLLIVLPGSFGPAGASSTEANTLVIKFDQHGVVTENFVRKRMAYTHSP